MTIRTHAHTDTYDTRTHRAYVCAGAAHMHRSGYVRTSGADTYVSTHTAPPGRTYVVRDNTTDPATATALDVWCVPTYTDAHGNALADRYGVPIVSIGAGTAYVETADGMGYASAGTDTYGAPTVPTTDTTPIMWPDDTTDVCAHGYGIDPTDECPWCDDTAPTADLPATTYAGTVDNDTTYTVHTDGAVTTRTYRRTDGRITTTYADANHMWTAPDANGDVVTYVVAEGTYWHTYARPTDSNRCTSVSWRAAGGRTCGHSFGAYGACIAPYGHPHADHIDANGHRFNGPAMARYGAPIGPVAPDTYTPGTRMRRAMHRTADAAGITTLTPDTVRTVTAYADLAGSVVDTHTDIMDTYRHLVCAMEAAHTGADIYADRITEDTYRAMVDLGTVDPKGYSNLWLDVYRTH